MPMLGLSSMHEFSSSLMVFSPLDSCNLSAIVVWFVEASDSDEDLHWEIS
jgi:hypothetical protein